MYKRAQISLNTMKLSIVSALCFGFAAAIYDGTTGTDPDTLDAQIRALVKEEIAAMLKQALVNLDEENVEPQTTSSVEGTSEDESGSILSGNNDPEYYNGTYIQPQKNTTYETKPMPKNSHKGSQKNKTENATKRGNATRSHRANGGRNATRRNNDYSSQNVTRRNRRQNARIRRENNSSAPNATAQDEKNFKTLFY